jgi:hypothetical protein
MIITVMYRGNEVYIPANEFLIWLYESREQLIAKDAEFTFEKIVSAIKEIKKI